MKTTTTHHTGCSNTVRIAALKVFLLATMAALVHAGDLEVGDFTFAGPLGSDGARIEKVAKNHFRVSLAQAPNHPEWPNKLNFQIVRNAKGNDLRLEEYFQSWSYDGKTWQPVQWEKGYKQSPQQDFLTFPVFERDRVFVGTQVPLSFEEVEQLIQHWKRHPSVQVHVIGESLKGRNLYRLEITDPASEIPCGKRWVHYFANQHPGEHNSQWRLVGMVDWILSNEAAPFRRNSICHVILMMSPDGPSHGWYRVNAEGVDMNRSYRASGSDKTYGSTTWTGGPHSQFGITAILCEGAGALFTKEENVESGKVIIKAVADYYSGNK